MKLEDILLKFVMINKIFSQNPLILVSVTRKASNDNPQSPETPPAWLARQHACSLISEQKSRKLSILLQHPYTKILVAERQHQFPHWISFIQQNCTIIHFPPMGISSSYVYFEEENNVALNVLYVFPLVGALRPKMVAHHWSKSQQVYSY